MKTSALKKHILSGGLDAIIASLYENSTPEAVLAGRARYINAITEFERLYDPKGERDVSLFSVPGRSEIMGNHTDHQYGRVIAASITLDCVAVAAVREDSVIRIQSAGFDEDIVDTDKFTSPDEKLFFNSQSIIAGVADGFRKNGYNIGGFDAYTTSNVLKGSGLSSSAAFEVMVGNILNHFYNEGKISPDKIAIISQYAENNFFGKPCGLMDQMACATGGFITIDFADPASPVTEKLGFDLAAHGYRLCITNTGGSHADLNDDYASVPSEMKAVASFFGQNTLRPISEAQLTANAVALRERFGDRALLRAYHFVRENERVAKTADVLRAGDIDAFFAAVLASGDSSYKYLQNVYTTKKVDEQGLSLALCLTEGFLSGKKAAWRVHGGGFAGTIQAFVPAEIAEDYAALMDSVFGEGACMTLAVRGAGAVRII